MRIGFVTAVCLLVLVGCGGGDGESPPPAPPAPPPSSPPPPPVIGTAGGTITESGGASVTFPAGAVTTDTTFRIAVDSTGAPPAPAGMTTAGSIHVVTPHGGYFAEGVTVRIPAPAVTLEPNQQFKIAKAEPGGEWIIQNATELVDGKLGTEVRSFSFFRAVIVTYPQTLVSVDPLQFTTTLSCGGRPCVSLVGSVNASYTALSNNGQMPSNCAANSLFIGRSENGSSFLNSSNRTAITPTGGSRNEVLNNPDFNLGGYYQYGIGMLCGGVLTDFGSGTTRWATWELMPQYPAVRVFKAPAQIDVVDGTNTNLEVILAGGAAGSRQQNSVLIDPVIPSADDRAVVDWLRSDNGGASWHLLAHSYQDDGNPLPFGTGAPWRPWSVRHEFIASTADQGGLIRVRACYTPIAGYSAPPCVTGPATRINVLQQSVLPTFTEQPRSVLIRAVETANFSASVSGVPSPTLRWQSRPANSMGDWTDVGVGLGATTANYITPPRMLSDNGLQYRVVATNAVGSVASSPVTVSVSEHAVAPSITTQPSALSVTTGGDAVFAVEVYGTEALSYQWRFNGAPVDGANSAILRLTGVTGGNAGAYSVYVSNSAGNVVSSSATLQVNAGGSSVVAPSITTQPVSATVNSGNTATFAVAVGGTGPFNYQWRRDGANISGANSAVYTINSVALLNAGVYSVVVSNSAGSVTSTGATLDVATTAAATPPSILTQPSTVVVAPGGSTTLAVAATGTAPLFYQWSLNGTPLTGATSAVLTLTNVGSGQAGSYTVSVSNNLDDVTSNPANVVLLGAPVITQEPTATTAIEGQTATFTVTATGSGLNYQWMRNDDPIAGAIEASYTTPMLVSANSGAVYTVMVYNGAGLVISQTAVLTVQVIVAPSVVQQPVDATISSGQTAPLCATFGGTPPMMVHIQQWSGGAWIPYIDFSNQDNDEICFPTPTLTLSDNGAQYRFVASNSEGQATSNIVTITVTSSSTGITNTTLVSAATDGNPPGFMSTKPSVSADGRWVAFLSQGTNLITGGTTNGSESGHAYLRDLSTGTTTLINRNSTGGVSARGVIDLALSSNGRYAVFSSLAGDLVDDDTNNSLDVFRRDLLNGTTIRVSVLPDGSQVENAGNGIFDAKLSISGDGRWVAFATRRDMTGDGSDSGHFSLYLRDVQNEQTRHVAGTPTTSIAYAAMSDSGEYIAYALGVVAPATQPISLYDIDAGGSTDIYTFDQSPSPAGLRQGISISANGRYVAFALNSVAITGSSENQVMVVDSQNPGVAELVSTGASGTGNGASAWPQISGDGRFVLYTTNASNLTQGGAVPWRRYTVMRDRNLQTSTFAGLTTSGTQVALDVSDGSGHALARDASVVAFVADHNTVLGGAAGTQVFAEPRR